MQDRGYVQELGGQPHRQLWKRNGRENNSREKAQKTQKSTKGAFHTIACIASAAWQFIGLALARLPFFVLFAPFCGYSLSLAR